MTFVTLLLLPLLVPVLGEMRCYFTTDKEQYNKTRYSPPLTYIFLHSQNIVSKLFMFNINNVDIKTDICSYVQTCITSTEWEVELSATAVIIEDEDDEEEDSVMLCEDRMMRDTVTRDWDMAPSVPSLASAGHRSRHSNHIMITKMKLLGRLHYV